MSNVLGEDYRTPVKLTKLEERILMDMLNEQKEEYRWKIKREWYRKGYKAGNMMMRSRQYNWDKAEKEADLNRTSVESIMAYKTGFLRGKKEYDEGIERNPDQLHGAMSQDNI